MDLEPVYNHIVLPAKLPGGEDVNVEKINQRLVERLIHSARDFKDSFVDADIQCCKSLNASGKLNRTSLLAEFRRLGRNDLLILHVSEQNAALLIRRSHR